MLSAREAMKITEQNDEFSRAVAYIEEDIRKSAELGKRSTWFYLENLSECYYITLKEILIKAGYEVIFYMDKVYIDWSRVND